MTENYREPLRCKICNRVMQGGEDHYCIPCVEHLEAVIDVLKERNAEQGKTIDGLQAIVRLDEVENAALKKLVREMCGIFLRYWLLMEEGTLTDPKLEFEADDLHKLNQQLRHRPEVQAILKEGE